MSDTAAEVAAKMAGMASSLGQMAYRGQHSSCTRPLDAGSVLASGTMSFDVKTFASGEPATITASASVQFREPTETEIAETKAEQARWDEHHAPRDPSPAAGAPADEPSATA